MLVHNKTNGEIRLTTEYRGITYKTKAGTNELQFESLGNETFAEAALKVLTDADTGEIDWKSWKKY